MLVSVFDVLFYSGYVHLVTVSHAFLLLVEIYFRVVKLPVKKTQFPT
jgi:Ni,Fe-hydrogenase I cytochrome b subunit